MKNWNFKSAELDIKPAIAPKESLAKVLSLRQHDFKHYLSLGFEPEEAFRVSGLSEVRLPTLRPSEKILEMGVEEGSLIVLKYNLYQEFKLYYFAELNKDEDFMVQEAIIRSNPYFEFKKFWNAAIYDFTIFGMFPLFVHPDYRETILNEILNYRKDKPLNHRYEWCEVLNLEQGFFDRID